MSGRSVEQPGLRLRLYVLCSRRRVDREIAGGAVVTDTAARRLRAAQLSTPEERRGIAAAVTVVLDSARERGAPGHHGYDIDAPLHAREGLLSLIADLRSETPMSAQGIALAQSLACERSSPLFSPSSGRTIEQSLAQITATMSPR
jgi:hypothetical protein